MTPPPAPAVAEMVEALARCVSSLEAEILARYGMSNGQIALHPIEQRRFLRDMREVDEYRALLRAHASRTGGGEHG